nr:MAG: RNA-dependent RNA polymerase [Permutotetraviridae sp.]
MAQAQDFKKVTVVAQEELRKSDESVNEKKNWVPSGPKSKFSSGFQLTLGDLLEADLGENPSKMDLVALVRAANKKTQSAKKQAREAALGELVPIPEPLVVPPMAKKWSAEHVREFMQKLSVYGVTPLQAILRDKRDPHFKKEGGLTNLMTHHHNYNTVSKDGDMYMCLAQLPLDKFKPEVINQVRAELAAANEWVMTNGPSAGLFKRLEAGLKRPKPAFRSAEYVEYVLKHFPIRKPLLKELAGMGARDLKWVRIDLTTSYGAPFMKPKVSPEANLLPQMMEIAGEIMAAIAEGKIAEWISAHPALCTALLKNKLDKYLLKETPEKIRPYYTYPAHWNVLFSALWQSVSDAAVSFLDDPSSINAHGFSWARGGAQKLYEWIVSHKEPGVYVAAYSDDQLWHVVTKDGKQYLLFPDYKMMDMSLGVPFAQLSFKWLSAIYEGKWDKTWQTVAELNCRMAFEKVTLVCFALAYLMRGGLGSGVPGTAEFDQIASCAAMKWIVPALSGLDDRAALDAALASLADTLKKKLGLEIKPETMAVHEFRPNEDYPWFSFLGHCIKRASLNGVNVYVPVRPRDKLVLSYVQPKGSYSGEGLARIRALQSRLIGITASGGWYYDEYYYSAKRLYEYYAKEYQVTPAAENDMTYAEYLTRPLSVPVKPWSAKEFPPRAWFQSLVAPFDVQEVAAPQGKAGAPLVDIGSVYTPGSSWADDVKDHDAFDQDIGGAPPTAPKASTDLAKQGQVEPLTKAQKDVYNAKVAGLRNMIRASYVTGQVYKQGKRARGTKVQAWLAHEADKFEAEAERASEVDDYDALAQQWELPPDDVLDEIHAERLDSEDLYQTYGAALHSRKSKEPDFELPPWLEGTGEGDFGRGGVT